MCLNIKKQQEMLGDVVHMINYFHVFVVTLFHLLLSSVVVTLTINSLLADRHLMFTLLKHTVGVFKGGSHNDTNYTFY